MLALEALATDASAAPPTGNTQNSTRETTMTDDVPRFIYEIVDTAIAAGLISNYQLEMRDPSLGSPEQLRHYDLNVPTRQALAWLINDDRESAAHSVALALSMACIEPGFLDGARPPVWAAAACVRNSLTAQEADLGYQEAGEFIDTVLDALSRYHEGREVISPEKRREVVHG